MFIAELFTAQCSPAKKWIKKIQCLHTMDNDWALKRNDVLIHATTQMRFEHMLSDRSQTQKAIYSRILFV